MPPIAPPADQPAASLPLMREPLHDGGRVALGPALDGSGHAYYHLAGTRRLRHGTIVGAAGAGVSNLATVLAVTARAATPLVTVYLNGHDLLTNPALAGQASILIHSDDVAETARTAVAALERAVQTRATLLAAIRAASSVAAGLPSLLVIIKDAHRMFADHSHRWAEVLRQADQLGIGFLALMHNTELASFGGNPMLRALLLDQVVALRTPCRVTAGLLAEAHDDRLASATTTGSTTTGSDPARAMWRAALGEGRLISTAPNTRREVCAFMSFRLAIGGTDEVIERGRRRWLEAYPDADLDAPTGAAFADVIGPNGLA